MTRSERLVWTVLVVCEAATFLGVLTWFVTRNGWIKGLVFGLVPAVLATLAFWWGTMLLGTSKVARGLAGSLVLVVLAYWYFDVRFF